MTRQRAAWAAVILIYLALAGGRAARDRPWADEAWFFSPAVALLQGQGLGTTVLEPANPGFEGIDRHTYWVLPLHLLAQAGWYAACGATLFTQRALSVVWGLAGLAALAAIVRARTGDPWLALAAAALLAVDPALLAAAANGRMDMMCAALGLGGLAAFLTLRARRFELAVAASHALVALSGLTHPNGVLYLAGLLFLQLHLDRGRLRARALAWAAAPYVMAALAYGAYAWQAPAEFQSQLRANVFGYAEASAPSLSRARAFLAFSSPLDALRRELGERWLAAYAGLRRLVPLAYLAAAGALLLPTARRLAGRGTLLGLAALAAFGLAFFNRKSLFFLVHAVPLLDAALAAALVAWARRGRFHAAAAGALAVALVALQVQPSARIIQRNEYRVEFLPAAQALAGLAARHEVVRGPAEFAYVLGFDGRYREDAWFGLHTGRRPDLLAFYAEGEFVRLLAGRPEVEAHLRTLLAEMTPVYRSLRYTIYTRREGPPP